MATTTLTVWSDLGCPWATLALATLRRAARERGRELDIEHRNFPLELFNSRPTPKAELDIEVAGIAGLRTDLGWRPWSAAAASYPVTMIPAMAAVRATAARAGNRAADQLDAALRAAFYRHSRCISLPSVILDVAGECPDVDGGALAADLAAGAGIQAVHDDWRAAGDLGVQGSPQIEAGGVTLTNPGVEMSWSAGPGEGFLRLDAYDDAWVDQVLATGR
ncbi:dithiol-disulfide isomerase [Pseudactinotalea sp. HY160]|uniref:DsbA family protein n=1 Tax=Pseudactinotalea sp. HY160 TaxID=2654490 RepID=UPI00128E40F8|nr:DsbA family protein [Pseudactinotalea sp. HY160]MPV48820.1 dithiol-disulfide isomerase [Pseudactinotalea sp. HY160]